MSSWPQLHSAAFHIAPWFSNSLPVKHFLAFPCCTHKSSMCSICPTKWPTRGVQALLSICSERFAEISSTRKAEALWKILVSVTLQSISHGVAIFLSRVFRKHQSCSGHVLQMVCAWKHMAFIVHIQTICPVYRPKARGSWKGWTHHTCSRANLGTCRKCIWNFYSAWTVSEILGRGNE